MAASSRRSSAERWDGPSGLPTISRWSDLVALKISCSQVALYPQNLIRSTQLKHELRSRTSLLDTIAPRLFTTQGDMCVEIWQVEDGDFHCEKLHSSDQLAPHISTDAEVALGRLQCRFIFVQSRNEPPCHRLAITREMMSSILSYHQVMPHVVDLLASLGSQSWNHSKFCSFKGEVRFFWDVSAIAVPELNRSGRILELCYNLSFIEPNLKNAQFPWTINNLIITHSFDVKTGQSIWVILNGNKALQNQIMSATQSDTHPNVRFSTDVADCMESCLKTNVLCCKWVLSSWPWYITYLEDAHSKLFASMSSPASLFPTEEVILQVLLSMQQLQDRIDEATLVLDTTDQVLKQLQSLYAGLHENSAWPPGLSERCRVPLARFQSEIGTLLSDLVIRQSRLKCLQKMTASRKILLIAFLEQCRVRASAKESEAKISLLAQSSKKEALNVRMLIIVTLFFLPASFVSTLQSADIMSFSSSERNTSRLRFQTLMVVAACFGPILAIWLLIPIRLRSKVFRFSMHPRTSRMHEAPDQEKLPV